jgi:small-conductance mechanosensitive channel
VLLMHMRYPIATVGTLVTLLVAVVAERVGIAIIRGRARDPRRSYTWRSNYRVVVFLLSSVIVALFWVRLFQSKSTFFGLLGAGFAVALREPLLSIAARISISAGRMYGVGDRIEFQGMAGDVIGLGVFYTRMLELGNWIHGDQATGRIVQFPNSSIYQNPVYNYTRDFAYIWDEVALPITYASNADTAKEILLAVGREYTAKFVSDAEGQLQHLRDNFFLPDLNLEPTVFTRITSNYIELRMRYLVDPRRRRVASSYLYEHIFRGVRAAEGIDIGSDTMDLTVHPPEKKSAEGIRTGA